MVGTGKLRLREAKGFAAIDAAGTAGLPLLFTLSTATQNGRHSYVTGSMKDRGMNTHLNDTAIDEIVATCNGDIRGALKALMLVNEQLEAELQQLHAAFAHGAERGASALH
jgi:replication-associated recombination protein RarA